MRWAFAALRAAHARYQDECHGHSDTSMSPERLARAFAALAESVWWVAALNEQLTNAYPDGEYAAERDKHPSGGTVVGLQWVRDRLTHQLPVTISYEREPFLPLRLPMRLSRMFIWRPETEITPGPPHLDRPRKRQQYTMHVAEHSGGVPVARAIQVFEAIEAMPGSPLSLL